MREELLPDPLDPEGLVFNVELDAQDQTEPSATQEGQQASQAKINTIRRRNSVATHGQLPNAGFSGTNGW